MKTKIVLLSITMLVFSFLGHAQGFSEKASYSNITEFGFLAASPKGVSFEATTVNGFCFNKMHSIGIGIGIGINTYKEYRSSTEYTSNNNTAYTPIFLNYRVYFKPENVFSPHLNLSIGGMIVEDGSGAYSSLTMGFRARKFSFSSGLSLFAVQRPTQIIKDGFNPAIPVIAMKWYYPFGITIKWGFAF